MVLPPKTTSKKQAKIKLSNRALLIVSIVFSLLLLEILSAWFFPFNVSIRNLFISSPNPRLLFELRPNTEIIFKGLHVPLPPTTIKVSSQGMRDYEYPQSKPKDKFRIAILGDSTGLGWGVEMEETAAKQLEQMLNQDFAGRFEVINFSVDAYNTTQEIELLESKVITFEPDLVIVMASSNDYYPLFNYYHPTRFFRYVPEFVYKSHFIRAALVSYYLHHERRREGLLDEGRQEVREALGRLKAFITENDQPLFFYRPPEWMEGLLVERGLVKNIIPGSFDITAEFQVDERDGHPNAEGHRKIAEDMYQFLQNQILKSN